jgi:NAD(P)-dependent dehydrogenase (short-subunit alcohol dehydrogenase family)
MLSTVTAGIAFSPSALGEAATAAADGAFEASPSRVRFTAVLAGWGLVLGFSVNRFNSSCARNIPAAAGAWQASGMTTTGSRWTTGAMPDQAGRTVLITGANSGLGLRSAEALASHGARVLMGCRNEARAEAARDRIARLATGPAPEVVALDLADLASVEAAAARVAATVDGLDVLMNNAGLMRIPLARTAQGFEMQFGVNHLGHFALTGRLLPVLLRATAPRVVTTASNAHRFGRIDWDDPNAERRYRKWPAYGQSKLANLLFVHELHRRALASGTDLVAVAAHPGYAATHLQTAGLELEGGRARLFAGAVAFGNRVVAQTDAMGALPQLYAATMPDVAGDDYYGPDGLLEQRGHPKKVGGNARSTDPAAARRLWQLSEELTGVLYPWP